MSKTATESRAKARRRLPRTPANGSEVLDAYLNRKTLRGSIHAKIDATIHRKFVRMAKVKRVSQAKLLNSILEWFIDSYSATH